MADPLFTYPSLFWLIPIPVVFVVLGWIWVRNTAGGLFMGAVATIIAWLVYGAVLHSRLEEWLAGQRVYAILFRDFPQDKEHFIAEYKGAFESGGNEAVRRKQEEMKIIMMVHHTGHYVERTPTEILKNHIMAEAQLLAALVQKNRDLCQRYLGYSGFFEDVWRTVGSDVFLASIRYNPYMIVEAEDHPELLTDRDRDRAYDLYRKLMQTMQDAGADMRIGKDKVLPCDTVYREFYLLTRMPPKDAALVIKLMYSENHLKRTGMENFLRGLMPFL